jgi:hypothetical protein
MTTTTYRKIDGRYTIGKVQGARGKYGIDYTGYQTLMGTTAVSVTATGVGVTVESPGTVASGIVWCWVSGGDPTSGADNYITLTTTMADGSIEVQTIYFTVSAR